MFYTEDSEGYRKSRPILLTSNSSWYLNHYRKLLISKLKKKTKYLIALTPSDNSSKELSKRILYIPLRINRKNDFNVIYLFFALIKMIFIVRVLKPKLIHSHTIKTNLITSLTASIYGIPCILSFTGMGLLSKKYGIKKFLLLFVLKIIKISSKFQRVSNFRFRQNKERVMFIFQNPRIYIILVNL